MANSSTTKEERIYNGEKKVFNNWCWENWTTTCRGVKLENSLTPYTKGKSEWIKDLNMRMDPIKLLEENIWRTLLETTERSFQICLLG